MVSPNRSECAEHYRLLAHREVRSARVAVGADPSARVEIGWHQVVDPCIRRAFGAADAWAGERAATAARRIGLAALAHHDGPIDQRVAAALAGADLADGLRDWLRSLSPAGRVPVEAAARAWVVDALALSTVRDEPRWWDGWLGWGTASGDVHLRAALDAWRNGPDGPRLFLVRPRREVRAEQLARFVALVHAQTTGLVAASFTLGHRDTLSRVHVPIGADGLERAVEELGGSTRAMLGAGSRPAEPGPWCGYCPLQESCDGGGAHLVARRAVVERLLGVLPSGADPQSPAGPAGPAGSVGAVPEPGEPTM